MEQARFAYLFQRYVDKKCSSKELDELMSILREPDHHINMEAVLDSFWESSDDLVMGKDQSAKILQKALSTPIRSSIEKKRKLPVSWFGWAAVTFFIGIAIFFKPPVVPQQQHSVSVQSKPVVSLAKDVNLVATTSNEHQKVTLPDGSTVILNSNSTLNYHTQFKGNTREVRLTGEGYFDIKHDDRKPFIVYTGVIKTTVLGTAFNIRAYKKQSNITVTVTRGKVSVAHHNKLISMLTPGQQIKFYKDHNNFNFAQVVAKDIIQWQESDLFFDDVSMEEAAHILSARFNTPITFGNSQAAKCRFTATFLKGESLQEIIKVICSFNNSTYQTDAGGITIRGEGCE